MLTVKTKPATTTALSDRALEAVFSTPGKYGPQEIIESSILQRGVRAADLIWPAVRYYGQNRKIPRDFAGRLELDAYCHKCWEAIRGIPVGTDQTPIDQLEGRPLDARVLKGIFLRIEQLLEKRAELQEQLSILNSIAAAIDADPVAK